MNILCIDSFCPRKTYNRTPLFASTPLKHGRHVDYWNQPLKMHMRICYLHCHESGLCCYLVIHKENLLRPLQLFYLHLWPIYWLPRTRPLLNEKTNKQIPLGSSPRCVIQSPMWGTYPTDFIPDKCGLVWSFWPTVVQHMKILQSDKLIWFCFLKKDIVTIIVVISGAGIAQLVRRQATGRTEGVQYIQVFHSVRTGPRTHPASYAKDTVGLLPWTNVVGS
jgi:hypothetical protein